MALCLPCGKRASHNTNMTDLPQTVLDAMRSHLSSSGDKKFHELQNLNTNEGNMASDGSKSCIVCGEESHRTSWDKETKDGNFVACDNHTDAEFNAAVKAATPALVK